MKTGTQIRMFVKDSRKVLADVPLLPGLGNYNKVFIFSVPMTSLKLPRKIVLIITNVPLTRSEPEPFYTVNMASINHSRVTEQRSIIPR